MRRVCLFLLFVVGAFARVNAADSDDSKPKYIPQILVVDSDQEIEELVRQGVIIWHRRADMLLACVPYELYNGGIIAAPGHNHSSPLPPLPAISTLDVAKSHYNAAMIHNGADETQVSIPTDNLTSGIYLITLTDKGHTTETCKIIVR